MKHDPLKCGIICWEKYISKSSTLLAASITESSRLKPLAAFSIPQAVPSDRIASGYLLPRGTNCIVDTHSINTNNYFWGDDSTAYRPSRFLERSPTSLRYNFWRFGFGPRNCMGKYVADIMIRVLVAHIVQHYDLGVPMGDSDWGKDHQSWISHPDTVLECVKL